jgi:hypothetical protein
MNFLVLLDFVKQKLAICVKESGLRGTEACARFPLFLCVLEGREASSLCTV